MIADKTIRRPALRYYGGKWNLAPWIISFFPRHLGYIEPCGGAASVLLQKPRSVLETYNDLDRNVVNYFRVLRDNPEELLRLVNLSPWSREEYEYCKTFQGNEIERARKYFVFMWQSLNCSPDANSGAWRSIADFESRPRTPAQDCLDTEHLYLVASRFQGVQIECRPCLKVIEQYARDNTLIYFDPPYPSDTREHTRRYAFEFTDVDHRDSAALLRECAGYVVVSGYTCDLYAELYEAHGWTRHDKEAQTNGGGKRIESVWLSPRTVEALNQPRQAEMSL